ncbi:hypothetical protein MFU01_51090 [Myxococcus fulvus]|uniref:Uncharacterized protein n=1 Tax=Myxococcus fulvus TaxID=33 RepID=A0A511T9B4_MYXFU|nr:hypothetical protein MFU01_51090 [Myxococcus fulvus]
MTRQVLVSAGLTVERDAAVEEREDVLVSGEVATSHRHGGMLMDGLDVSVRLGQ